jgi:hypothetical protein
MTSHANQGTLKAFTPPYATVYILSPLPSYLMLSQVAARELSLCTRKCPMIRPATLLSKYAGHARLGDRLRRNLVRIAGAQVPIQYDGANVERSISITLAALFAVRPRSCLD